MKKFNMLEIAKNEPKRNNVRENIFEELLELITSLNELKETTKDGQEMYSFSNENKYYSVVCDICEGFYGMEDIFLETYVIISNYNDNNEITNKEFDINESQAYLLLNKLRLRNLLINNKINEKEYNKLNENILREYNIIKD